MRRYTVEVVGNDVYRTKVTVEADTAAKAIAMACKLHEPFTIEKLEGRIVDPAVNEQAAEVLAELRQAEEAIKRAINKTQGGKSVLAQHLDDIRGIITLHRLKIERGRYRNLGIKP